MHWFEVLAYLGKVQKPSQERTLKNYPVLNASFLGMESISWKIFHASEVNCLLGKILNHHIC